MLVVVVYILIRCLFCYSLQKDSIMKARWPTPTAPVDMNLRKQAEYVDDAVREFRLKYAAKIAPPKVKVNISYLLK
jgi:hypothetical protein